MALLREVELSPDGKRVAVQRTVNGNLDIWLINTVRGMPTRFTFDPAFDQRPVWSPDGSRVAFDSNRQRIFNLYWKLASGAGGDELLLESEQNKHAAIRRVSRWPAIPGESRRGRRRDLTHYDHLQLEAQTMNLAAGVHGTRPPP